MCWCAQVLSGRHIRVDLACGAASSKDHKLTVFVGNLPFTATEDGVRAWFAGVVDGGDDSITNVRIVRDKMTNKGKGIAYVMFTERMHVFQALAQHGKEYEGRTIRVTHCKADVRLNEWK